MTQDQRHTPDDKLKVVVAQIGARENFQVPRLCYVHGALVHQYGFWKPLTVFLTPIFVSVFSKFVPRIAGRSTHARSRH